MDPPGVTQTTQPKLRQAAQALEEGSATRKQPKASSQAHHPGARAQNSPSHKTAW